MWVDVKSTPCSFLGLHLLVIQNRPDRGQLIYKTEVCTEIGKIISVEHIVGHGGLVPPGRASQGEPGVFCTL